MPFFSLKKIDELTGNHQTYLRGVRLYNAGRVRQFCQTEGGVLCAQLVMAEVSEDGTTGFRTEFGIAEDGTPAFFSCTCGAEQRMCAHLAAMLVRKYYADMVEGLNDTAAVQLAARERTDEAARRLSERALARRAAVLEALSGMQEKIRLYPVLDADPHRPQLSFTLGNTRQYVLKDISRFCADMAAGRTVTYGKNLSFVHHPESFAPDSRPLLAFLCGEYGDMQPMGHGAYAVSTVKRDLSLTPGALDRLMDLYLEREMAVRTKQGCASVTVTDGFPALSLVVDGTSRHGVTVALSHAVTVLHGATRLYVLCDGKLYRTPVAYAVAMEDILTVLSGGRQLFVAESDLDDFCSGVLADIGKYWQLSGDVARMEAHRASALSAELYLDARDRRTVTLTWKYRYGGQEFNPLCPGADAPQVRDRLAEMHLTLVAQKYLSDCYEEDGVLLWEPSDGELYRFVQEGVAELDALCAVYATDAFTRVGGVVHPHVRVGVRMHNDLLQLDVDIPELESGEVAEILQSYREAKRYHRLRSGRFVSLDEEALCSLSALAEDIGCDDAAWRDGRLSVPLYRALYIDRLLDERSDVQFECDGGFRRLVQGMQRFDETACIVPETLENVMRGYQKTGYRWMMALQSAGFSGILADDMGLGKTLQVIAVLLAARQAGNILPSLVVCPTSVVLNWASEIRRFAPDLTVLCVMGDMAERAEQLRRMRGYDVVVTSYDLLKRDIALYTGRRFFYEVLDEAQFIKNHTTLNARAVKTVEACHRLALTGTPVENHLSELWSIFDFLMPGYLFGYNRFRDEIETPIVRDRDKTAEERLRRLTAPFILRRLKREVLRELPPKTERVQPVSLDGEQRTLYRAALSQARQSVSAAGGEGRMAVLAQLMRLRRLCCDPSLCFEDYSGPSAKLESCMQLLHEAADGGHKVLLFSQFTDMLAILRRRIEEEGLSCYVLQGSTPKEERADLVDRFNRDATNVFLISLKAGGTGLNLTGADVVIHYDPWWNIAAQNQATDRAYRIGQRNPVQVIRLIAHDTVEERILHMQEEKQALADAIIREDGGYFGGMTAAELLALFD